MKLLEALSIVKSKSSKKGRSYSISSLLSLIILGYACNCDSIESVCRFGKMLNRRNRMKLGFDGDTMPSCSTLRYNLQLIDIDSLNDSLSLFCGANSPSSCRVIDIDGKTVRGSKKQGQDAHHILSAFVREQNLTIGQVPVKNCGKETPGCMDLLDRIDIEGDVIVADASFTNNDIMNKIIEKQGNFVLCVKGNTSLLEDDVKKTIEANPDRTYHHKEGIDKGHGRIEQRSITTMDVPTWKQNDTWNHIRQIAKIDRFRSKKVKGKWIDSNDTAYIVTSLTSNQASPQKMLDINRGHWSIENRLHWVKDVIFNEDRHNLSSRNACSIISKIRDFIIHIAYKTYGKIKATRELFAYKINIAMDTLGFT